MLRGRGWPGIRWLLAVVLVAELVASCGGEEIPRRGERVIVTVDPAGPTHALEPRYLGYAFDTAQLTGGKWWEEQGDGRVVASLPDLEDPKLRRLVAQIGPSVLRVGGTDCDAAYFCPDPGPCELPPSYQDAFQDHENRHEGVIQHEAVDSIAQFADAVDSEILFCINVGPGPRDASGIWSPDNARQLIRYAKSLPEADRFALWEPGNEINSAMFNFNLTASINPDSFVDTLITFRALVDAEDPGARVPAPGSYITPWGELQNFTSDLLENLDASGLELLDAVSFHLYATQSTTCPMVIDEAVPENLFSETLNDQHRGHLTILQNAAGARPLWNTESASAQCGGQHGLSDTLADALWWANWIGFMAEQNTSLVIRHALVGADYALLASDDFEPRPTFLTLVLYHRLVSRLRLDTTVDRTRLKAHAYCHPDRPGAVTVVLVNPGPDPRVGQVSFTGARVQSAQAWQLAGPAGLGSYSATINGEAPAADGTIPDPAPRKVGVKDGTAYPALPPATATFVTVEVDPPVAACQ